MTLKITKKFSLIYPVELETEKWIVHILDKYGLLTGEAGIGKSPEEAIQNAQSKIDIMMQSNED